MKKNNYVKAALLLFLVASLIFTMCSCGGKKEASETPQPESAPAQEEVQEEPEEKTIEWYYTQHPDELQDIKDSVYSNKDMQSTLEVLDFDVYPDGSQLVYDYKYKTTYTAEQVNAAKGELDKNLEKMEKDMKDRIVTIETGYGVQNVVIRILYRNGDGSIITEKYFTR